MGNETLTTSEEFEKIVRTYWGLRLSWSAIVRQMAPSYIREMFYDRGKVGLHKPQLVKLVVRAFAEDVEQFAPPPGWLLQEALRQAAGWPPERAEVRLNRRRDSKKIQAERPATREEWLKTIQGIRAGLRGESERD